MKATGFNAFMARVDAAEFGLCRSLNRGAAFALPRRIFQIASRLGDGIAWYVLLLALPLLYGAAARATGCGHGAHRCRSECSSTPCSSASSCASGPSSRTPPSIAAQHRSIATASLPAIRCTRCPSPGRPARTSRSCCGCWLPLAALIAASRMVLGLHYPSDVLAGAAIGAGWRPSALPVS